LLKVTSKEAKIITVFFILNLQKFQEIIRDI